MARVSITEAARLAGVSRGNLYKTYIKQGKISVSKDSAGKKFIETSELLRVFGSIQDDKGEQGETSTSEQGMTDKKPDVSTSEQGEAGKDVEIKLLREQLSKSEDREQRLLNQIDKLTDTVKLLEAPKYPRLWWQFWK